MKKLLLILIATLALFPATVSAQTQLAEGFQKMADRLGIERDRQAQVLEFAEGLKGDMVVGCSIASVYPPAIDIAFASGKEIHADGDTLKLIGADSSEFDYSGLCYGVFILGYLLILAGFFTVSLQFLATGIELIVFVLALCL